MSQSYYWNEFMRKRLSRRAALKGGVLIGASLLGGAVAACGESNQNTSGSAATTGPAGTKPAGASNPTASASPKKGGTLTVGVRSNPSTLDPAFSIAAQDGHRGANVYETLFVWDKDENIVPLLALSWELLDPKTFVVKLRQGVKFHDGTDFNAAAVKAHFDRILDPNAKSPLLGPTSGDLASVDAVDNNTVKFNLKAPRSYWLEKLASRLTWIPSPTAVQKYGADLARHPVGTGPFEFVEWVQDSSETYKRFDGYWDKGVPYLDKLILKIIPDETARLAALKAGEIDMADAPPVKDVPALKSEGKYTVMAQPGWPSYIHPNHSKPPFDNKAAREAISWALDREAIHNSVYFSTGSIAAATLFPPTYRFYDSTLQPPKRDLKKAKDALAAAGVPNGFKFQIKGLNEPLQVQVMQIYKAQLAEVGIQVEIAPEELVKYATDMRAFDFDALAQPGGYQTPEYTVPFDLLAGQYSGTQGYWRIKPTVIQEFETVLEKIKGTYDQAELKKLYNEAERVLAPYYPLIPVHGDAAIQAISPKVHGYFFTDQWAHARDVWLD